MPASKIHLSMISLRLNIQGWLSALEPYSMQQLCAQPGPACWSMGQLYQHLLAETSYYLKQASICTASNNHAAESAAPAARKMFVNDAFPDEIIEGAPENAFIPQPAGKEQLVSALQSLQDEVTKTENLITTSSFAGKTKHPGLGYFNAGEWLQFAGMHLHHHARQKKRIDDFLKLPAADFV